jgi:hypothetical protein
MQSPINLPTKTTGIEPTFSKGISADVSLDFGKKNYIDNVNVDISSFWIQLFY